MIKIYTGQVDSTGKKLYAGDKVVYTNTRGKRVEAIVCVECVFYLRLKNRRRGLVNRVRSKIRKIVKS